MLRYRSLGHRSSRSPSFLLARGPGERVLRSLHGVLLMGLAPALASAQICFETNPVVGVGFEPRAVHAADLNGDRLPDLVVANTGSTLTVALSEGASFAATDTYVVGLAPLDIQTADLDADGDAEIVTANRFGSSLSVLLNDGAGNFGNAIDYPVGGDARSVALADFDGDLDIDALVAGEGSAGIWLLFNDGAGGLNPALSVAVTSLSDLIAADLDGDGDVDAAATRFEGSTVVVFLNQGDGTFAPYSEVSALGTVSVLTGADFDGDGDFDLAVGKLQVPSLQIMLNHGDGTFDLGLGYNVGTDVNDIVAIDLESDGDQDVALTRQGGLAILLNQSNGVFAPLTQYGPFGSALATADWNLDGAYDIFTVVPSERAALVWINDGDATFPAPGLVASGLNGRVFSDDLDGDDDLDLAATNVLGGLSILHNGGNGVFAPAENYSVPMSLLWDLEIADLDNDGDQDIAMPASEFVGLTVLRNAGNGAFPQITTYPIGLDPFALTGADYDGDGDHDLAVLQSASVKILRNAGDGSFTDTVVYELDVGLPYDLASADMDGDGMVDLLVRVDVIFGQDTTHLLVLRNQGSGAFAQHWRVVGLEVGTGGMSTTDIEGDGDIDVAWLQGQIALFRNPGTGLLAAPQFIPAGHNPTDLEMADIDQDGDLDFVVADPGPSSSNLILNQGGGAFAPPLRVLGGPFTSDLTIADFDGDRDIDIVVANFYSQTLGMLRNCATSGTSFCFGDGSQGACPCNNNAPAGSGGGCLNSFGTSAILRATGPARLLNDGLVLECSQLTDGAALYFQGTAAVHSAVFGDGLRCVGGTLTRLAVQPSTAGLSSYPAPGDVRISVRGEVTVPGVRVYQTWYRNAATFCTSAAFNMTNAISVVWSL
jgi:hypothetical protein